VLVAVNNSTADEQVQVSLPSHDFSGSAQPYLTSTNDNGTAERPITVSGGTFSDTVPARSVVSYVVTGPAEAVGGPRQR
jgi:glucuronoarabinoxylan endo-1,4-beta-xylanase